ncbi:hypothetical protein MPSEU_001002400 [Mayamaea pseudoterrestris]|nr:hypothetical protein MPSEU_001002400 [Mayamaea pseudoterrestris]
MAPRPRKKVLCLGVSYANVQDQLASMGKDLSDLVENENESVLPSYASAELCNAVASVQRGLLTEMDGRDLARIVETERVCKADVYTVSREKGAIYRSDRHYEGDFNHRKFVASLKDHFSGVTFDQVLLDYFWIPTGWDRQHWSRSFFESSLVSFATLDVVGPDAQIYLPFCLHCFKEVLICQDVLLKHYNISFLRKIQLNDIALWKGTQNIDRRIMQGVLGKQLNQEEVYCSFGPQTLAEDGSNSYITNDEVRKYCRQLEDFASIRFIVLQALPKVTQARTRKQQALSERAGQIQGLVPPECVRNGFDQMGSATFAKVTKTSQATLGKRNATGNTKIEAKRVSESPKARPFEIL